MSAKSPARRLTSHALVVIAVVLIAVVNLLPVIWGLLTSFKTEQAILVSPPQLWGFPTTTSHYVTVLNGSFSRGLVTSLIYASVVTALGIFIASITAFALDRLRFRGKGLVFYTIVACVPLSIGASILAVPNYMYFSALHMLNKWYTMPVIYLALNLPLATWVLKGSVEAVPKELDQSGKIDGLSNTGVLFRIVLPLCRPGMFAAGMLIFIGAWNEFIFGTVLVRDAALKPVQVAVYQYISSFGRAWGPLTAAAILAVVPILILLFILGRHLVAGLMRGSVKG
jgi:ABC-type glycerol-3-phosphate transport system permease component